MVFTAATQKQFRCRRVSIGDHPRVNSGRGTFRGGDDAQHVEFDIDVEGTVGADEIDRTGGKR